MSSREIVIDLINKLLADVSLAGIEKARLQARQGAGISAEDGRKLVDAWASK